MQKFEFDNISPFKIYQKCFSRVSLTIERDVYGYLTKKSFYRLLIFSLCSMYSSSGVFYANAVTHIFRIPKNSRLRKFWGEALYKRWQNFFSEVSQIVSFLLRVFQENIWFVLFSFFLGFEKCTTFSRHFLFITTRTSPEFRSPLTTLVSNFTMKRLAVFVLWVLLCHEALSLKISSKNREKRSSGCGSQGKNFIFLPFFFRLNLYHFAKVWSYFP